MKKIILIGIGVLVLFIVILAFIVFQELNIGEEMSNEKTPFKQFSDLSQEKLQKLAGKRIFFGHQSVGGNIVEGIEELARAHESLQLNIVKTTDLSAHEGPVFAHARIGKNLAPRSKVEDFARIMRNGLGDSVDIAFFKFCYVDIHYNSDIRRIFAYYQSVMEDLQKEFPDVKFIHVTVPYHVKSGGLKGLLKNILRRDHNIKRSEYNRLLRSQYGPQELFDLAWFESTYPDGRREKGGKKHYALVPDYCSGGGHLNKKGGEIIAIQLLDFLASL